MLKPSWFEKFEHLLEIDMLADLDYIVFECSTENSSLKIGFDDELVITVNVQF